MIATIFLVGGLIFPPVWLLVQSRCNIEVCLLSFPSLASQALLFTKKSKKEYSCEVPAARVDCVARYLRSFISRHFLKFLFSSTVGDRIHQASEFYLRIRQCPTVLHAICKLLTVPFQILCTCVYVAAIVLAGTSAERCVQHASCLTARAIPRLQARICRING
jgi:hypothetical protein